MFALHVFAYVIVCVWVFKCDCVRLCMCRTVCVCEFLAAEFEFPPVLFSLYTLNLDPLSFPFFSEIHS